MTKRLKIASLLGAGVVGLVVSATAVTAAAGVKPASLANEIAQKFHLNQSDVQTVIDQHRSEMQIYARQNYEQRLDAAVTAGTITATQKDQILAKMTDLQMLRQSLQGKTPAERQAALKQARTDLKTWAQANNIPQNLLMGAGGFGHRGSGV